MCAPPLSAYTLAHSTVIFRWSRAPGRIENEKGLEERQIAAAAEKKRQAKLRRARERERRKEAAVKQARHEEEMARIERWDAGRASLP